MIKRKPSEWCELIGVEIIDADGWTRTHNTEVEWNTPITAEEFLKRVNDSTVRFISN